MPGLECMPPSRQSSEQAGRLPVSVEFLRSAAPHRLFKLTFGSFAPTGQFLVSSSSRRPRALREGVEVSPDCGPAPSMRRAPSTSHVRRRKTPARDQLRYPSAGVTGRAFYVACLDQSIEFFGDLFRGRASGLRRHVCSSTVEGGQTVTVRIR